MMFDAGLEHTAGEYGMRWIAESREGARGASDSRIYASEIEAQLAAIHELMGAHHRTLGLGRRLAIRLGAKKARDTTIETTSDGAVLHVELEGRDGSDLARAWSRGLRSVLRRSATRAEARLLDAFEQALLAQRPGRTTRSERIREEWFERTFEAFVDAEGWSCGGGDVAATTRTAAKREATGPNAAKYPDPGPAGERWAWLPASDSVRERTNWLWHMFRAAIEWDIDCPGLRGTPEVFAEGDRHRREHQERGRRAAIEFARVSARSIANARAAGHAHAPVIGMDEDGPTASIIALEGRWHEPWTRDDDGRPPNIDTPWLAAQVLEGLTEDARDSIGLRHDWRDRDDGSRRRRSMDVHKRGLGPARRGRRLGRPDIRRSGPGGSGALGTRPNAERGARQHHARHARRGDGEHAGGQGRAGAGEDPDLLGHCEQHVHLQHRPRTRNKHQRDAERDPYRAHTPTGAQRKERVGPQQGVARMSPTVGRSLQPRRRRRGDTGEHGKQGSRREPATQGRLTRKPEHFIPAATGPFTTLGNRMRRDDVDAAQGRSTQAPTRAVHPRESRSRARERASRVPSKGEKATAGGKGWCAPACAEAHND